MTQSQPGAQCAPVLVVVGVGGMGKSIPRRLGSGKTVLFADFNNTALTAAAAELRTTVVPSRSS